MLEILTIVFTNDEDYKHSATTFMTKPDSSKLKVRYYGIVQAYKNARTSELLEKLTGSIMSAYLTSVPTDIPTSMLVSAEVRYFSINGYPHRCLCISKPNCNQVRIKITNKLHFQYLLVWAHSNSYRIKR